MYGMYGYRSSSADTAMILLILAVILALAGAIVTMILVTPEKRRPKLNKFFRGIADICNFKGLLLEYIAKFCYIFENIFIELLGLYMLFNQPLMGLLLIVLGPIVLRIGYEFIMMFILIVKNVIQINNKMPGKTADPMKFTVAPDVAPAPKPEPPKPPQMVFCAHCGTRYDANQGGCPNGCKE